MLIFDPELHRYALDGRELPSVTTVLEDIGIVDYSRIPHETRETALARGRRVHLATCFDDEYVFGINPAPLDESTVLDEDRGYVEAWRRFRVEKKFRTDLIEHRGYNAKWMYAGTLDRSGYFEGANYRALCDLKTGEAHPGTRYQLAAYAEFFEHPRAFLKLCVELHEDTTYRLFAIHAKDHAADFGVFCNALAVYRAKRSCAW